MVSIYTYLSNDIATGSTVNCLADLEAKLLVSSRNFFQKQSSQMMGNLSLVEYMTLADKTQTKEKQRLQKYLTWQDVGTKVINEFQQELLLKNQTALLQSSSSASLDG